MPYDKDVSTENVTIDTKRRISRVVFNRNDNGGITSEAILDEAKLVDGKVISNQKSLIRTEKDQFWGLTGFTSFVSQYINLIDGLKTEYDASGSLATGSLQVL